MRTVFFLSGAWILGCSALGCSAQGEDPGGIDGGSDARSDVVAEAVVDGGDDGFIADVPLIETGPPPVERVYANTDQDLWRMDPATKTISRIGDFVDASGTALAEPMTDIAVDKAGNLFGNSVGKIYTLKLPAGDTGNVTATVLVSLPASSPRMYALGFAPSGVLGAAEALIGGDAAGDLYLIPTDGSAPLGVGTFGKVTASDPGGGAAGDYWQLSGDIAFFEGTTGPIGLATLRPCTKPADTATCKNGNDVLVEIDVTALAKKSATSNLKKRFIGTSGTGFGRLYGLGAWGGEAFAFQRFSTSGATTTALFLSISLVDGKGKIEKDFPTIAAAKNGWSGAGVTTKAKIDLK
ncbi:MAG: hypothetical protein IPJ34_21370 [Myxococcales bacterium]|nr:hypothetical protein [Myxococcales bacterium]